MSAAEVIELIKKLPPAEQAEVREFVANQSVLIEVTSAPASDTERALAIGRSYITRHPDLFRKLAQ
jgi:hypothetical protein